MDKDGMGNILMVIIGFIFLVILLGFIWGCFALHSTYSVWSQKKHGQSEYAFAESQRQIKILEAKAAQESAHCYAEAEIIRAKGVAEANKIIGESLNNNESYLRYLWVQGLQTNNMQVVYVPTEANLPVLEAGKR